MSAIQLIGRRSSLFTRMALIFAEELRIAYELIPIYDMTALGPEVYADNPALKLPIMRYGESTLFGTLNICRAIAEHADSSSSIAWPEDLRDDSSRNAQELVWHCMSAQVQLVMGTIVGKLPADNVFFVKARAGIENSLRWLDSNLPRTLDALPSQRSLSVYEVSLFCLIEHLAWRKTLNADTYDALAEFAARFGATSAAQRTAYQFDVLPSAP